MILFRSGSPDDFLPEAKGKSWVQINPIQCQGNPWEESLRGEGIEASDESVLIRDYYSGQGIEVFEVRKEDKSTEVVCLSCSCLRGDILHLLVSDDDVPEMLEIGYKLSS